MAAVAGAVISGAGFGTDILSKILGALGDINRKIAIGVSNETRHEWTAENAYFSSGTSDVLLPQTVPAKHVLLYDAHKNRGPVATGVVGTFAYYVSKGSKGYTIGVLYSVPFDYNLYENWWNVKVYDGKKLADNDIYV